MNKQDLIEVIAKHAAISKKSATHALEAMLSYVATLPEKKAAKPAKRKASKPRAGVKIKVKAKAAKVPKFKPGKALRDAVR